MLTDPALLLFLAGSLTGAALTLLIQTVPDVRFLVRWLAARRRRLGRSRDPFTLGPPSR